ncbi:hypothetical protein LZ31DRAFT_379183 [Colletotrichum somersetense]|nr:hypothetical protein LZ31DRAFT_379183 [Colletotrichum somersetense]
MAYSTEMHLAHNEVLGTVGLLPFSRLPIAQQLQAVETRISTYSKLPWPDTSSMRLFGTIYQRRQALRSPPTNFIQAQKHTWSGGLCVCLRFLYWKEHRNSRVAVELHASCVTSNRLKATPGKANGTASARATTLAGVSQRGIEEWFTRHELLQHESQPPFKLSASADWSAAAIKIRSDCQLNSNAWTGHSPSVDIAQRGRDMLVVVETFGESSHNLRGIRSTASSPLVEFCSDISTCHHRQTSLTRSRNVTSSCCHHSVTKVQRF